MSKYHPCSKEFQEEAKRLGLTGNQLIQKYINEGKIPNPTDIARETNKKIYQNIGFKNSSEYLRTWRHDNCIQLPMSENKDCAHYLGTHITERKIGNIIIPEMVGKIKEEMPPNYPGYDFITINDTKVDIKSCCSRQLNGWIVWEPHVRYNRIADYFIIVAFDNRTDLNIIHIWMIHRDEKIRGDTFYIRDTIKITNKTSKLMEFNRFDWIKKLSNLDNNNKTWT